MAATDIFNPNTGYSEALGFNPNWNYGSPRTPPANYATQRPRFGTWASRSIGNAGRTFTLTFVDRPIQQVRYIENFYHQFQRGFFTLIDYDNGSREHVVRITGFPDITETANLKYTIRIVCEEVPGAPMRNYPSDFTNDAHWLYAVDDFLNPTAGTLSSTWVVQQTPAAVAAGLSLSNPASYEAFASPEAAGDFAQQEYVGFGFQMALRMSYGLGTVNILLDEVAVVTGLNLSTGALTSATATVALVPFTGPVVGGDAYTADGLTTVTMTSVPLGRHRVKIQVTTNGPGIFFPAMQVIH